jgi:hypothetical protein
MANPEIQSTSSLKIGDYILLKQSKYSDGRLSAEGIITDEIFLMKDDDHFDDCLWQIHVQNQYSAVREYEEVLFSTNFDEETMSGNLDPSSFISRVTNDELISQLHRAAVNEGRLNEKLMLMKIGKPVAFGDVIQLRHVKSNKYLTVNSTTLAQQERENLRICLDSYGDPLSWLEFMPRSKGDREGSLIAANTETLLRVHERPSEYIHCAKLETISSLNQRKEREVNCSLETSSSCWNLSIFHHAHDVNSKFILAGQMITLREPESSHFIVPNTQSNRVTISPSSILTMNSSTACTVGSHLLWTMEKCPLSKGGLIGSSRNDRLLLKHLNSGLYMKVESSSFPGGASMSMVSVVKSREEGSVFEVLMTHEINSSSSSSSSSRDESVFQLCTKGLWLYASSPVQNGRSSSVIVSPTKSPRLPLRGGEGEEGENDSMATATFNNLNSATRALLQVGHGSPRRPSLNLPVVRSCVAVPDRSLATYFSASNNLQQQLGVDLYLGVEARRILRSFESITRSRSILKESVASIEARIKNLFAVLEAIFEFLTDDVATSLQFQLINLSRQQTTESRSLDGINKNSRKILIRQTLMREQGVLSAIIDIIELCGTPILTELPSTVRRRRENPKGKITRELSHNHQSSFKRLLSQLSLDPHATVGNNLPASSSPMALDSSRKSFTRLRTFSSEIIQHTTSGLSQARRSNRLTVDTTFRQPAFGGAEGEAGGDELELDQLVHNLGTLSQDISSACFKALLAIIYDNHSNQIFIADKFPILLNQVKDQELAVVCVQEMLRDNLQMLQTKVCQILLLPPPYLSKETPHTLRSFLGKRA